MPNNTPPADASTKTPGTPKSGGENVSVLPSPSCEALPIGPDAQPYVTPDEVERALKLEPHRRREALVRFLWMTGCRISEALALREQDVDVHLGLVRMVTLKRRVPTSRTIPLSSPVLSQLVALAAEHKTGRPFPWSVRVAYGHVRKALGRAGAKSTNPHALRHGHAMHALRSGAPLATVSRALGHANIATTSEYLKATAEDVRRDYARVRW